MGRMPAAAGPEIEMTATQLDVDYLNLGSKSRVLSFLSQSERIVYSNTVVKLNKRGKPQERVLMLTTAAVYNLSTTGLGSYEMQRKIPLFFLSSITVSSVSDEFILHVPREYDYRLISTHSHKVRCEGRRTTPPPG